MRIGSVGILELAAAMLWILPGLVLPSQQMLRGFLHVGVLPRTSNLNRNLARLPSFSKEEDGSRASKQTKKSSKASKKSKKKANTQRKKPAKPPKEEVTKKDDPSDVIPPSSLPPPCSPGDEECVALLSEDYEFPLYDFSSSSQNWFTSSPYNCRAPEGTSNAFFHWGMPWVSETINDAYGKEGTQYDTDYGVSVTYLKTWSDPDTEQKLKFSGGVGGSTNKYAIGMGLEDEKLRLELDGKGQRFVSFGMDIAAAANDPCGSHPNQEFPTEPSTYQISAIDKASTTVLDTVRVNSDSGAPDKFTILWTRVCGSLDISQAENGIFILEWDALAPYLSLLDNLNIIASDDPNKRPDGC